MVRVFSNCEQVTLYLNDSLISTNQPLVNQFSDQLTYPPFEFDIDHFEPGTLRAQGLINGELVAEDRIGTPGEPYGIRLKVDSLSSSYQEENDLLFVYAEITDRDGNIIPTAFNEVTFDIAGNAELIGENPVKAEAGIASILIRLNEGTTGIAISADSEHLASSSTTLR